MDLIKIIKSAGSINLAVGHQEPETLNQVIKRGPGPTHKGVIYGTATEVDLMFRHISDFTSPDSQDLTRIPGFYIYIDPGFSPHKKLAEMLNVRSRCWYPMYTPKLNMQSRTITL